MLVIVLLVFHESHDGACSVFTIPQKAPPFPSGIHFVGYSHCSNVRTSRAEDVVRGENFYFCVQPLKYPVQGVGV